MMLGMEPKLAEPSTRSGGVSEDRCPDCEHTRVEGYGNGYQDPVAAFLRRLFRMKPAAARCLGPDESLGAGVWGYDDCGCKNDFHGS